MPPKPAPGKILESVQSDSNTGSASGPVSQPLWHSEIDKTSTDEYDLRTVMDKYNETPFKLSQTEIQVEECREKQVKHPDLDIEFAGSDEISDSETKTIMVKGYKSGRSTDTLRHYFENKTRSGGGEVESVVEDKENEYILIMFEEESAVKSVCNKARTQPHIVEGYQLSVTPFVHSLTDLLFTNIPEDTSEDHLRNFLEAKLKVKVAQVPLAYNISRDRAVVKFTEPIDPDWVVKVCKKYQILDSNLIPMPVCVTKTILATNLPEDVTEDTCKYYFENHEKSGGGNVEQIELSEDMGYCLITFEDYKVVDLVCSREIHCLHSTALKVTPHHLCLGRPVLPEVDQPWICPEPYVTETGYKSKLSFIDSRDARRKSADEILVAPAGHVFEDAKSKIQKVFDKVARDLEQKKQRISKKTKFEEWKIKYLQLKGFHIEMQSTYPDVRVVFEADGRSLEFIGPQTSVTDFILELCERLQCVKDKSIKISREALTLLGNTETQQQISNKLRKKHLLDLWESNENSLIVITEEGEDFATKKMIFKDFFANMEFQIDAGSEILKRADKWSELQQKIQDDFRGCVVIQKAENKIKLCCTKDVKLAIEQYIQQFISKNSISSEEICIQKYVLQFMKQYMDREIRHQLQIIQRNAEVKVEYQRSDTVLVQGTADGLSEVRKLLGGLKGKVKFRQFKVDRPGARQYFTSIKGQESIKSVETNTPCIIHLLESDGAHKNVADQGQTLQMLGLEQSCGEALLPTGQKVIVYGGSMLELKVDVIVNTANEEMKFTGGLSAAIVKSGGKSIQQECSDFVKNNGSILVGNVIVSGGGNLSCKHIVHAVGPRWQGGTKKEPDLLQSAVENSLVESDQRQCASVAIPALCTGVYRYPIDMACMLIVTTIKQYFQNKPQSTIRQIYLCDINPKTVNAFKKALSSVDGNKQLTEQGDQKSAVAPIKEGPSKGKRPEGTTIMFGNTQVEVIKGNISEEKVDVIVNSASGDLDLGRGKASLALLKAGGSSIQDDCKQKYPNGISVGEIAVSIGGQLKCNNVLHICLETYSHKKGVGYLEAYIENCLAEADRLGARSVAFPAVGTGAQGFPASIVAGSMFTCVSKYCQDNKDQTSIKSVKFVIFHMDTDIHETFLSTLQQLSRGNRDSQPTSMSNVDISILEKKIIKASEGQSIQKQTGKKLYGRRNPKGKTIGAATIDGFDQTQDDLINDGMDQITTCVIEIYAEGSNKVDDAFKRLKTILDNEWHFQKIEDPVILKLDSKQVENIKAVAKKNNVLVNIDQDFGGYEIQGLTNDVIPVKDLINEELRIFDRSVHEKRHAELLTNMVKWFWITNDEQKPFEDIHNLKIEDGFKNTLPKVTLTDSTRNEEFEIDFKQMQMTYVENPAESYLVIRRDMMANTMDAVPSTWHPMEKDENLLIVDLPNTSQEYKNVLAEFNKTLGRIPDIIKIERIQNNTLYQQYTAKKRLMETCNPSITNERVLWHGTDDNAVANIAAHGFNRRYCGKNATICGEGVYFAVKSVYSDMGYAKPETNTGHKRMYRALVLVGHYTQGAKGMRVPPVRVRGTPDILYDSVTNNMQDPEMFVIFHDTQAYPEHIITYT